MEGSVSNDELSAKTRSEARYSHKCPEDTCATQMMGGGSGDSNEFEAAAWPCQVSVTLLLRPLSSRLSATTLTRSCRMTWEKGLGQDFQGHKRSGNPE